MSTPINDGGPAFPVTGCVHPNDNAIVGMTLRDYFAGQALAGLCVRAADDGQRTEWRFQLIANVALKVADAMLAARERKEDAP